MVEGKLAREREREVAAEEREAKKIEGKKGSKKAEERKKALVSPRAGA